VRIGIVDDGLQTSHPDLSPNVDTTNGKDWNGNDSDPNPGAGDDHGTACAGDAAARGNNGIGVSGSAPEATLVGMRLIAAATTDTQEAEAMNYLPQLIQIKSNSWGPDDTGDILEAPGPLTKAALQSAAETGRDGKGTISMWAGGNGLDTNDNSNYDGYANSIYTIAVGAFDSLSRQAWYSEPGANLVITSPSSGDAPALGKTTTDRTGSAGYVAGDYESDFGGTSSATPTAAGVVALMLEANPNLGWRDVQEILMRSAKKVNPSDADWKTPIAPANINHNHKFGAGLVDASAAVNLAIGWTNLGEQLKRTLAQSGLSVAIPNQNTTGITREFTVAAQDNIRVEHVTVTVDINHTSRGNLKITLTSPSGTVSRLAEVHSDSGNNFPNWTFMTVRNWGENHRRKRDRQHQRRDAHRGHHGGLRSFHRTGEPAAGGHAHRAGCRPRGVAGRDRRSGGHGDRQHGGGRHRLRGQRGISGQRHGDPQRQHSSVCLPVESRHRHLHRGGARNRQRRRHLHQFVRDGRGPEPDADGDRRADLSVRRCLQ
jgi:hypothetical protein